MRYSFTQPQCRACWIDDNPNRQPVALLPEERDDEICCTCGEPTDDGIYIRVDPQTVPHPTITK